MVPANFYHRCLLFQFGSNIVLQACPKRPNIHRLSAIVLSCLLAPIEFVDAGTNADIFDRMTQETIEWANDGPRISAARIALADRAKDQPDKQIEASVFVDRGAATDSTEELLATYALELTGGILKSPRND